MRWRGGRQSKNVEDRRGMSPRGKAMAGGGIGAIIIALIAMFVNPDLARLLQGATKNRQTQQQQQQPQTKSGPIQETPAEKEMVAMMKTVLGDTEVVWQKLFREQGRRYEEPVLVLFRDKVQWAGGVASSAMGPFYSPTDKKVYIDLSFFNEMARKFDAPGDFAQAYVLAHEVGHHVQNLLGISDKVHKMRSRVSKTEYNRYSVRLELQADFFAGVWAHHADNARNILERGDVEEALNAAAAIGDDALQRKARGHVVPDSFTHGTSAQRVAWFRHGLKTGRLSEGDTFDGDHFRRIDPIGR